MIAHGKDNPPDSSDCDKAGRVLIWDRKMGYWSASKLHRALDLLHNDPTVTHWMQLPESPSCLASKTMTDGV